MPVAPVESLGLWQLEAANNYRPSAPRHLNDKSGVD